MNKLNTGVNPADWQKPAHDEKDYYVGAGQVKKTVFFSGGHGIGKYLPAPEFQKKKVETMACVSFSHNNCIEILANFLGIPQLIQRIFNIADRALAWMSGTTENGNSPNTVCETFRKKGFLWEEEWPYPDSITSWKQFYSSIPTTILQKAIKNLAPFEYSHEWVTMSHAGIKEALQYGPIQAIGFAWIFNNERGFYIDGGNQPNHAFVLFDYVEGKHWFAYDSYAGEFEYDPNLPKEAFIKKLDWNFTFGAYGKQMTFRPKTNQPNLSLIAKLKNMFQRIVIEQGIGRFWHVKTVNGKKQKREINSWLIAFAAIVDEVGAAIWPAAKLNEYTTVDKFDNPK